MSIYNDDLHSYFDLINYKIGYSLYTLLKKRQFQNTILFGNKNTGKTLLIKKILNELYGPSQKTGLENNMFLSNPHYTYFNCQEIENKHLMFNKIKGIVKTINCFNNSQQMIILDNFEKVNIIFQNMLKVVFEKSHTTTRFLLIMNHLNHVIAPIQSRFPILKIKSHSVQDKFIYYNTHFNGENPMKLYEQCKHSSLKKINKIKKKKIKKHIQNIIKQIYLIFQNKFSLKEISMLANKILIMNLPLKKIFIQLIKFLSLKYSTQIMMNIVKEIAFYEHKLINSFRDVIYLESILIRLYKITHESL